MSQMRRTRRFRARFCASRSEILSPMYSAIFLPRLNETVAKQPLPLIVDLPMVRPGASLSFTDVSVFLCDLSVSVVNSYLTIFTTETQSIHRVTETSISHL